MTPDKELLLNPEGSVSAEVTDEGLVLQVPNRRVARLIQLGLGVEREQRRRQQRRRTQRAARRRNRSR